MAQERQNEAAPKRTAAARSRQRLRIASVALIVVGAVIYVRGIELLPNPLRVPLPQEITGEGR